MSRPTIPIWTDDPKILLDAPLEIIYTPGFDEVRNINAMARFVILWTILAYLVSFRPVVFVIGAIALFLLSRQPTPPAKLEAIEDAAVNARKYCQSPSEDNPLGNPTPHDYGTGEAKLPACPQEIVQREVKDALRNQPITGAIYGGNDYEDDNFQLSGRTFYSVPVSGVPDQREAFVHALYGSNISRPI
tara:strand:+ start:1061 stop:1627 length:567 start_codon:yes stop_codon:yes gene_type:complete